MSDYICNWEKCFLCQEDLDENKLVCPTANPNVRQHPEELKITYLTQIKNRLDLSHHLGQLPTNISVDRILGIATVNGGGAGHGSIDKVLDAMMANNVVWHKIPCRTSVDSRRVQEAKQKASTEFPYSPTKKRLRSSESCFKYQGDVEDDSVSSNGCQSLRHKQFRHSAISTQKRVSVQKCKSHFDTGLDVSTHFLKMSFLCFHPG